MDETKEYFCLFIGPHVVDDVAARYGETWKTVSV